MKCDVRDCIKNPSFVCNGESLSFICVDHIISHHNECSKTHMSINEYIQAREKLLSIANKRKLEIVNSTNLLISIINDLSSKSLKKLDDMILNLRLEKQFPDIPSQINHILEGFIRRILNEYFSPQLSVSFSNSMFNELNESQVFNLNIIEFDQYLKDKVQSLQSKEKEIIKSYAMITEIFDKPNNSENKLLSIKLQKLKAKVKSLKDNLTYDKKFIETLNSKLVGQINENVYLSYTKNLYLNIKEVARIIRAFKYERLNTFIAKHSSSIQNIKISNDLLILFICNPSIGAL